MIALCVRPSAERSELSPQATPAFQSAHMADTTSARFSIELRTAHACEAIIEGDLIAGVYYESIDFNDMQRLNAGYNQCSHASPQLTSY